MIHDSSWSVIVFPNGSGKKCLTLDANILLFYMKIKDINGFTYSTLAYTAVSGFESLLVQIQPAI